MVIPSAFSARPRPRRDNNCFRGTELILKSIPPLPQSAGSDLRHYITTVEAPPRFFSFLPRVIYFRRHNKSVPCVRPFPPVLPGRAISCFNWNLLISGHRSSSDIVLVEVSPARIRLPRMAGLLPPGEWSLKASFDYPPDMLAGSKIISNMAALELPHLVFSQPMSTLCASSDTALEPRCCNLSRP